MIDITKMRMTFALSVDDNSNVKGEDSEEMDVEEAKELSSVVPDTVEEEEEMPRSRGRGRGWGRKTSGARSAKKTGLFQAYFFMIMCQSEFKIVCHCSH